VVLRVQNIVLYNKIIPVATTTPQCHFSLDCSDAFPVSTAPFGDCCNSGRNSFRLNSLGGCISCESRGESMNFLWECVCIYMCAVCVAGSIPTQDTLVLLLLP